MMSHDDQGDGATLEITVESAEGLNKYSSYFTPVRPFITLTKLPSNHMVYQYDGRRGTREHVFRVPVDPTFFSNAHSCLHLQLYNKRRFVGPIKLGSCLIPTSDIALPLLPRDSLRYLSYRLRATDGSRAHLIINLSFRLLGWPTSPPLDTCQTVIGIPVTAVRRIGHGTVVTLQQ